VRMRGLTAGIGIALLVAVALGAYTFGLRRGERERPAVPAAPVAAPAPAAGGTAASGGAAHPALPGGAQPDARYTHYRVGNSNVKAILADGPIVWIGTSGGVIRYDTATDGHRLFDVRSGLLSNGVFHLSKLDGRLAVGTYGGGLSVFDAATETWENYNIQDGLADAFVYDLLKTSHGDVWIATWSGANRVRGGQLKRRERWETFTVQNTKGGLPNDWVYGLREGRNGEIWLATEGGLARYHDGRWSHWKHSDGLGAPFEQVRGQIEFKRDPAKESSHHARQKAEQGLSQVDVAYNPNYIVSLEVDADGSVWAGTWGGGLAHFDGQRWRNYTVADGLPADHVFLLRRDDAGRLWVGTSKGLALWNAGRFQVFTTADGLFADNVFSLALSERGNLWVGSYGGVSRFAGVPVRP